MTKLKLLKHLIDELNTMSLIHEQCNTYAQKIKFQNSELTHQFRGEMILQRWVDGKGGYVTWGEYKKSLTEFEMVLLEGVISANHHRILYF